MTSNGLPWINPIGGLGDTLMVSGVLKQVFDRNPARRYNLIRRSSYLELLKGHPAIAEIGFPPLEASIMGTDYWSKEELGPGSQRAYQILARMFGLATPVEERFFVPGDQGKDPVIRSFVPWKRRNILIAPSSASPRKETRLETWRELVRLLILDGILVLQAGRLGDRHVENTYSLIGLTTPRQLISLLDKFDVVVTSDNFVMHAAHLVGVPTVALWGPTDHRVYGYPEQIHLQGGKGCDPGTVCLGPGRGDIYGTPCPLGAAKCTNRFTPEKIHDCIRGILNIS